MPPSGMQNVITCVGIRAFKCAPSFSREWDTLFADVEGSSQRLTKRGGISFLSMTSFHAKRRRRAPSAAEGVAPPPAARRSRHARLSTGPVPSVEQAVMRVENLVGLLVGVAVLVLVAAAFCFFTALLGVRKRTAASALAPLNGALVAPRLTLIGAGMPEGGCGTVLRAPASGGAPTAKCNGTPAGMNASC